MREIGILLPIVTFLATWAALLGHGEIQGRGDWRRSFLESSLLWGTFVALSAEGLSLVMAIEREWLAASWAIALVAVVAYSLRHGWFRATWRSLIHSRPALTGGEKAVIGGIGVVSLLLLLTAWLSPPNNYDSLLYHMARVVHWAQDSSLRHFPSGFEHQLTKPIWAETAILHLRLLWGDDRPANLVQWFSMLGSLVGVSAVVGLLGGRRRAQILASAIALSIPMGLLQATSTQNDYAVAFWMVCLAYFVVKHAGAEPSGSDAAFVGLSTALGTLTKGTAFVYATPFLLWFFLFRRQPLAVRLREAAIVGILAVTLNAGFWTRNFATFGGPYGTSEWLAANLTLGSALPEEQLTGGPERLPEGGPGAAPSPSGTPADDGPSQGITAILAGIPKDVARIVAYQVVPPFRGPSWALARFLGESPDVFPADQIDRIRTKLWNHEDYASSPLQMVLAPMAFAGAWLIGPRDRWRALRIYTAGVAFAFLLIPIVIGHAASVWGIRYVLPFFILSAPSIGLVIAQIVSPRLIHALAWAFIGLSLPWALLNNTRPLIGYRPRVTAIESVLSEDRTEILLANRPQQREAYAMVAQEIRARGCRFVGLQLTEALPEYPVWWILDAPQSGIRIESISHTGYTNRYVDPAFEPCLVVCTECGGESGLPGYSLAAGYGWLSLLQPRAGGP